MFCQVIDEHPTLPSEVQKAKDYANTLGISKVDVLSKAQPEISIDSKGVETTKAPSLKAVADAAFLEESVKEVVVKEVLEKDDKALGADL